jgi:hypothetical protein
MLPSPLLCGENHTPWPFELGTFDVAEMTEEHFGLCMHNISNGQDRKGTGTFHDLKAAQSWGGLTSLVYYPSEDDVASHGMFKVSIIACNQGSTKKFDLGILSIE